MPQVVGGAVARWTYRVPSANQTPVSVFAHGLTASPGANRYADWYAAHNAEHKAMPESVPAPEHRVRGPLLRRHERGASDPERQT